MNVSTELVAIDPKTRQDVNALVAVIRPGAIVITTQDEYTEAGIRLVAIKGNIKKLDAVHTDLVKDLKSALTKWSAFFKVPRDRLVLAEADEKAAMGSYLAAEQARHAAAQKLLAEAAAKEQARIQKLADDAAARARADADAARQREAAIQAAAAQAAAVAAAREQALLAKGRAAAAQAAREKAEAAAALAKAAAALEAAKAAKIEAVASVRADLASVKIASLAAPVTQYNIPQAAGVGARKVWTFEVLDETKLPREYTQPDEAAIRKAVAAGVRQIEGVRIYEKQTMTSRAS